MKKILVVGCGFSGVTFGRLAAEAGFDVTIIDKRDHIGGNCYSYKDEETGVEVHKYGPHIFHTNSDEVWNFVNRFGKFNDFTLRTKARTNGGIYTMPVNLMTINQFFKKTLSPAEAEIYIEGLRVKYDRITNFEEFVTSEIGVELYEGFYKYYTMKQWGVHPTELNVSTAKRLPIRLYYDDNYFNDKYQGIPEDGYTSIFERMLDMDNIKVLLGTDFNDWKDNWQSKYDYLVYTGSIDNYYDYCYGKLSYRTLTFKEIRDKDIQGNAIINYTDMNEPFTRITEHKWFTPGKKFDRSVAHMEFSAATDSSFEPYYPVRNAESDQLFSKYEGLSAEDKNVIFLGRLAEFKYYDMHQVIGSSLARFKKFMENLK